MNSNKIINLFIIMITLSSCSVSTTRYRRGNSVYYRYGGLYRNGQLTLRETVLKQSGNHLEIEVQLDMGKEKRRWRQYITDNDFNRQNNIVDRLVEISSSGTMLELLNPQNRDLYRLYEGTYVRPDGLLLHRKEEKIKVEVCGKSYNAIKITGVQSINGKEYYYEEIKSSEFLWTNISGRYYIDNLVYFDYAVEKCT